MNRCPSSARDNGGISVVSTADIARPIVNRILTYLSRDPVKNLPRIISLAERIAISEAHKAQIRDLAEAVLDNDSNWRELAIRVVLETDPHVLRTLFNNFLINATLEGTPRQYKIAAEIGSNVPFAILMDPTEKCNLKCTGCWAGDYQHVRELSYEAMDRVCNEAKELGIHLIIISGGEPLVAKHKVLKLAQAHLDQAFHLFTNGTLFDGAFIDEMVRLGNITAAISLEGLEEHTDARRGKGVYARIMHTMDMLREAGIPFGFSACYARNNTEVVASDEFIDTMVDKGCTFGWFFTYVPVGSHPDLDLMATPGQRRLMYEAVRRFRGTKPVFLVDFWNDAEYSLGCIAGGRRYLHINANGDVEPCAFVHYALDNINSKSLKDVLASPLMKAYQARQPFNRNMLRPCPLIDNPEKLVEIITESGAKPTELGEHRIDAVELAEAIQAAYAGKWEPVADDIWRSHSHAFHDRAQGFLAKERAEGQNSSDHILP